MMPVAAYNLLQSISILATCSRNFATQCVDGLRATDRGPAAVERGLMTTTGLAPRIGYDAAAAIAKEAYASGRTIREVARERTDLSEDELTALLDPEAMTMPGRSPPPPLVTPRTAGFPVPAGSPASLEPARRRTGPAAPAAEASLAAPASPDPRQSAHALAEPCTNRTGRES